MKRLLHSFTSWAALGAGLSLSGGIAQAAVSDYAGSYAANLASLEVPAGGGEAVETFYGRLELTVNANGIATGALKTRAGKSYPLSTKVVESGMTLIASDSQSQNNVGAAKIKGTSIFAINFSLSINTEGVITVSGLNGNPGDVNGLFFAAGSYKFLKFTGTGESIPEWAGNYTVAFLPPEGAGEMVPAGAGFASLSVNSVGKLIYKGKLGDGTAFTGSANPIAGAVYSIFTTPPGYAAGGYFTAELDLDQRGELTTPANWNKPAKISDKAYPAGFSTAPSIVIQPWIVPAKKAYPIVGSLGFGTSKNFTIDFSGEGLLETDFTGALPDTVRITGLSKIQAVAGGASAPVENNSKEWNKLWNVNLNPLTGVFSGKQTLKRAVGGKTVVVEVDGVVSLADKLGMAPFAFGQYRVSNVSGLVTFSGPLINNVDVGTSGTYSAVAALAIPDACDELSDPAVGGITNVKKPIPGLPGGLPTLSYGLYPDGNERKVLGTFPIVISEDLQTMTFNGRKLKLVSYTPIGTGVLAYNTASAAGTLTLHVARDSATGQMNGFIATYFQFAGFSVKTAVFTASSLGGSSGADSVTSITKK